MYITYRDCWGDTIRAGTKRVKAAQNTIVTDPATATPRRAKVIIVGTDPEDTDQQRIFLIPFFGTGAWHGVVMWLHHCHHHNTCQRSHFTNGHPIIIELEDKTTTKTATTNTAREEAKTIKKNFAPKSETKSEARGAKCLLRWQQTQSCCHKNQLYMRSQFDTYGFCTDPSKPSQINQEEYTKQLPYNCYIAILSNKKCHDYCHSCSTMPSGVPEVLSLGLKFCIKTPTLTNKI
jgi:hypothetical protein